jgi:hypothetical protein
VVEDRLGLDELGAGVDLLLGADRLVLGRRAKGRPGRAQEPLRPLLDLAPVQVLALVAHPPQHPDQLHRVQVRLVGLARGRRAKAGMVAAQTEDVADAQPRRAHGVRLQCHPAAVARLQLHHRFQAVVQAELAGGDAAHARRGGGVVGEVRRGDVAAQHVHLLVEQLGRGGERRCDLRRHHESAGAQTGFQAGDRFAVGGRMVLCVALPPGRLAQVMEETAPLLLELLPVGDQLDGVRPLAARARHKRRASNQVSWPTLLPSSGALISSSWSRRPRRSARS